MRRRKLLTTAFLTALAASLALSQERGGPGRGGPGGFGPPGFGGAGFGGPGFGGRLGPPVSNLMLLMMPEVRKEIGIANDQQQKVDDLLRETQDQMQTSMENVNFQELQSLPPKERDQRFAEMRKTAEESAKKADGQLATILDAKQLKRLNQLQVQREGERAFRRPEIAKQLELTDKQIEKLDKLQEDAGSGFGSFGRGARGQTRQKSQSDALAVLTKAQQAKWADLKGKEFQFPEGGGGGFGGPGPGGPGGPMGQERPLVKQFDKDSDGRLNKDERQAARDFLRSEGGGRGRGGRAGRGGPPGFGPPGESQRLDGNAGPQDGPPGEAGGPPGAQPDGPPGGRGLRGGRGQRGGPGGFGGRGNEEPAKPGPRVDPASVATYPQATLYDPTVLRTFFLEFESPDWEAELADFNNTDVEVPATLIVDGKKYPNVGVHFRGMSSFMMVGAGHKRSLNLSLDFVDPKQRLYGYKTLNLLNSHEDPSFLHTVLYFHIARNYLPAPKANFVKVAINGESWGVYINAQQFNKDFLAENYPSAKGVRWKVQGSPGGRGGLEYMGDNIDDYKRRYAIKTDDGDKAWKDLIALCRTLNETPSDQLEAALEPILDVDGALWFLALENALINSDGYWIRASDYCIYRDPQGKFHVIPHDANETFQAPMGPGMFGGGRGGPGGRRGPGEGLAAGGAPGNAPPGEGRRGPGRGGPGGGGRSAGIELDPLVGLDDSTKPLRSRLLAVPALKVRYLDHVRTIARDWLDWDKLGPVVARYEKLIEKEIEADTRKLTSFAAFKQSVEGSPESRSKAADIAGERRPLASLREFAEKRRAYLLGHPEIKALAP